VLVEHGLRVLGGQLGEPAGEQVGQLARVRVPGRLAGEAGVGRDAGQGECLAEPF